MNVRVLLSKLVAGPQNPRRVKPEREAHRRLVASIRAHGLLVPLLVHPVEGGGKKDEGKFEVIAGNRRLAALREVHRGDEEARVACITRPYSEAATGSLSLAENFAREPMHPLDEAEAFDTLAGEEGQNVAQIAADFGVGETYVRQRMKLAGLAGVVKASFRRNEIGVGIAEAFAAVPEAKQEHLWKQLHGKPRDAQQVRGLIENAWIEGRHALFAIDTIDPASITHDLFGGSVLIERGVFMQAQAKVLEGERLRLQEEGWKDVVVTDRTEARPAMQGMEEAERVFDAATAKRLNRVRAKREKLQARECKDIEAQNRVNNELDRLDREEEAISAQTPAEFSEGTKARGTVFIVAHDDGSVERHYTVPRRRSGRGHAGNAAANGRAGEETEGNGPGEKAGAREALPTCDELSPRQLADLYAHQALAVREALSKDRLVRKRLVVLALHPNVMHEAVGRGSGCGGGVNRGGGGRYAASGTNGQALGVQPFRSPLRDQQEARFHEADPFKGGMVVDEAGAYAQLQNLTEKELDALIGVLIVEAVRGRADRPTPLVSLLSQELGVNLRASWTPDADWLGGYQKAHLADLVSRLGGSAAGQAALSRKKSELVAELAGVFERSGPNTTPPKEAASRAIADKASAWLPAVLGEGGNGEASGATSGKS